MLNNIALTFEVLIYLTFDHDMLQKVIIPFWKWQSKPPNIGIAIPAESCLLIELRMCTSSGQQENCLGQDQMIFPATLCHFLHFVHWFCPNPIVGQGGNYLFLFKCIVKNESPCGLEYRQ